MLVLLLVKAVGKVEVSERKALLDEHYQLFGGSAPYEIVTNVK